MNEHVPLRYRPLTEVVLERIAAGIAQGAYEPGVLYSAHQVAEKLGVSRSPTREALLRLQERGAVQVERNRGFRVRRPHRRDINEIFEIRLAFEVDAAGAAAAGSPEARARIAKRLETFRAVVEAGDEPAFVGQDRGLHDDILDLAGNQRVRAFIGQLREETHLLGGNTMVHNRGLDEVLDEHLPIGEAIVRGDEEAARSTMEEHLRHTLGLLLEFLSD